MEDIKEIMKNLSKFIDNIYNRNKECCKYIKKGNELNDILKSKIKLLLKEELNIRYREIFRGMELYLNHSKNVEFNIKESTNFLKEFIKSFKKIVNYINAKE